MATKKRRKPPNKRATESAQPKYPPSKILIIEDAEAKGDVAAAYDFWRGSSGRHQVPGINASAHGLIFYVKSSNFRTLFTSRKGISFGGTRR